MHANEIVLLAYYVAAINIEETYHDLAGGEYEPFNGIVLTDTFQMNEADDQMDGHGVFPENNARVETQKALDIRVVIGNPPYSKGQESGNDDNQNLSYPSLDARISSTYAARSSAKNKNNLYDSYIRAIRWASDRIADRGVVCFVSNGGFIDGNSADGLRRTFEREFSSVYVLNLRGNQRTAGEESRKEGGKIFGTGSRATIAIYLLIRNPDAAANGQIQYHEVGDYLTREAKLAYVRETASYARVDWVGVQPNAAGDWINQGDVRFGTFPPVFVRDGGAIAYFADVSQGIGTSRDAWVTNFSASKLLDNVRRMVSFFNSESARVSSLPGTPRDKQKELSLDPTKISWSSSLMPKALRGVQLSVGEERAVKAAYRGFGAHWLYFDPDLNHRVAGFRRYFPTRTTQNFGIAITGVGAAMPFTALAVDKPVDLSLFGAQTNSQFLARRTFSGVGEESGLLGMLSEAEPVGIDNVTDGIQEKFQEVLGERLTKDEIFSYVYGVLHSPEYRSRYAADLNKGLPRVPILRHARTFVDAGQALLGLHLNYETANPYSVTETRSASASDRVEKMRYAKKGRETDKTTIIYNSGITISGIPDEAHEYMLGSRSALDWIVERYQVKTDKASGIVNDPNDWADEQGNPRYILDLVARIVTVSVETVRIVKSLPPLEVIE